MSMPVDVARVTHYTLRAHNLFWASATGAECPTRAKTGARRIGRGLHITCPKSLREQTGPHLPNRLKSGKVEPCAPLPF